MINDNHLFYLLEDRPPDDDLVPDDDLELDDELLLVPEELELDLEELYPLDREEPDELR